MSPLEVIGLALGSGGVGSILTAAIQMRLNHSAVQVDQFNAIVDAQNKRIDELHRQIGELKANLHGEMREHNETKRRYRITLRYIRDLRDWLNSSGVAHLANTAVPGIPSEVQDDL